MGYLLGIDYGTGGAKACLTDIELNIVAYAFREYEIILQKPSWSEHRPEDYWRVTCEIIHECMHKSGIDPREIVALATSCALPSMVLLDSKGDCLVNAYNLMDRRATAEVAWLKENIGEQQIFELSANRLEDHPSIVKLMWEINNRPEIYSKVAMVHTIDSYIKFKLTGVFNVNFSEGPLYGVAYDIHKNEFNEELLKKIGIDRDILPSLSKCDEIIGAVTEAAASETGLAPGIPVASGQVDACAGWLGGGAINVGDVQMNLGTCGNFGVIHKNKQFMNTMINCAYTVDCEDTYVVIPTTTTGGQLVRYMRDNFSPLEVACESVSGISAYEILDREAEKVPAGCEGLVVLPYLMGERTPIWDVNARGVIFGLSLNHNKAHVLRAMMESVAYALYSSFELIKVEMKEINFPIVLNEGGAKSKLWRQIITDVFNQPTVLLKNRAGAPYGDCILAGKSIGLFKDYSIAKDKAEYIDMFEPDMNRHEMYMEYYELFKKLYFDVKESYQILDRLRKKFVR